ncbi:MAG: type II toxin-antitoxin system PemK/MazF family toxin [Ardenticatenaceae bacterium]
MGHKERIRRGDVYLIGYAFPHEQDSTQVADDEKKKRPILILQNNPDNNNQRYPLVSGAPITSQKVSRIYPQDVFLKAGEANLEQDSKVLLGLTQAFPKTQLEQRLGHLSRSKMKEVDAKFLRLFGFRR